MEDLKDSINKLHVLDSKLTDFLSENEHIVDLGLYELMRDVELILETLVAVQVGNVVDLVSELEDAVLGIINDEDTSEEDVE